MWLQRLVIITAATLFVLLLMGGLVHNTGSSLRCPDWPGCEGQLLPKVADTALFLEHYAHRMLGATLGLLTLTLLVGLARRAQTSGDLRLGALGLLAFATVSTVGLLGRYTVLERLSWWASSLKLALASFTLVLLVTIYFRLDGERRRPSGGQAGPLQGGAPLLSLVAALVVYVQMVLGAIMRHRGAGLACPDLPLCRGQLWPSGMPVDVLIHALHRLVGLLVVGVVGVAGVVSYRRARTRPARFLAALAPLLVLVQLGLGLLTIVKFLDLVPRTAHLGVAELLLCDLVALHLTLRVALPGAAQKSDRIGAAA